jgi:hypothetical protein
MKTTNGIPCNDYLHTPKAQHDRIVYRFVSDDGNTVSSCTIRLGDTDPLTGEAITDMGFFTEYHKLAHHQVYENLKASRVDLTPEEKRRFREEKAAFAAAFEKKYGYMPARSDLRDALADRWPKTYHLSIQELINDDGDSKADRREDLSEPAADPFGTDLPIDIACLQEVAASLTGRLADVYEALLVKYAGGKEKITFTSLAEKWRVSHTQIGLDRDKIIRMIRKAVENARKENEE